MNTKLTLTVDKEVIEQAKRYARQEGRSLSNLIESYLRSLVTESSHRFTLSPIASALKGSCKIEEASFDYDYDAILETELTENYLRDNKK